MSLPVRSPLRAAAAALQRAILLFGHLHVFAKIRAVDVRAVSCDVCRMAVTEAHASSQGKILRRRGTATPDPEPKSPPKPSSSDAPDYYHTDFASEFDVRVQVENPWTEELVEAELCNPSTAWGRWLTHLDLVNNNDDVDGGPGGAISLIKRNVPGECRQECTIVSRACREGVAEHAERRAELLAFLGSEEGKEGAVEHIYAYEDGHSWTWDDEAVDGLRTSKPRRPTGLLADLRAFAQDMFPGFLVEALGLGEGPTEPQPAAQATTATSAGSDPVPLLAPPTASEHICRELCFKKPAKGATPKDSKGVAPVRKRLFPKRPSDETFTPLPAHALERRKMQDRIEMIEARNPALRGKVDLLGRQELDGYSDGDHEVLAAQEMMAEMAGEERRRWNHGRDPRDGPDLGALKESGLPMNMEM